MDLSPKDLSHLFEQLGLPNDDRSIDAFIDAHCIADTGAALWQAPFWNAAQASFLREAWEQDADWVEVIDTLGKRLYRCEV